MAGQRVNTTSSPAHTPNSTTLKPATIPRMCGMVLRKPKFAPEAVNITLLGPGVMDMTNEYVAKGIGSIMAGGSCEPGLHATRNARRGGRYSHRTLYWLRTSTG